AAPHLSAAERALLRREPGSAWTISDVPLLDEAAELLGDDDTAARLAAAARAAELAAEQAYARDVLSVTGTGAGIVSAQQLADRYVEGGPALTVAERAEADRTWAYGHVVVDEAQELSPMMWRLLMRRCPSRSMTLVGDTAQTGSAAGAGSWGAVLDPFVEGRWRQEALTVNYRTPAQIMALATAVLTAAGVEAAPLESVRDGDVPPRHRRLAAGSRERDGAERDDVDRHGLDRDGLVLAVREELAAVGTGRMAVIAPERLLPGVRSALVEGLPPGTVGTGRNALDSPVAVLGVTEAKGLEFDGVVLLEPADVLGGSRRGANDLYVALTRPTQRLLVLHAGELPPGFAALG
ncbi:MAG: hypothetical protein QOE01_2180, partial [Actinomycetota bacterium]|nr:hypothetical protein [Actinomycetota bacterium]